MYLGKRIVTVLMATVLLLLASCNGADTTWAYKYGDMTVPAGVYIENIVRSASDVLTEYTSIHSTEEDFEYPTLKNLLKQEINGEKTNDLILSGAQKLTKEFIFIEDRFKADGLELSALEIDSITDQMRANWDSPADPSGRNPHYTHGTLNEANGISFESSVAVQFSFLKKQRILLYMYSPGGEKGATEAELKKQFGEYYTKGEVFVVSKETENSIEEGQNVDAVNAEIKVRAEGYLERIKAGENVGEIMYEYLLDTTTEEFKEELDKPTQDQYTAILTKDSTSPAEGFTDKMFAMSAGSVEILDTGSSYYIIKKMDILEDPIDYETYKDTFIINSNSEALDAYISEEASKIDVIVNEKAIGRYTPSKIRES